MTGLDILNTLSPAVQVGLLRGMHNAGHLGLDILNPSVWLQNTFTSTKGFISDAMVWSGTKEGHRYWQDIYDTSPKLTTAPIVPVVIGDLSGITLLNAMDTKTQYQFLKNLTNVGRQKIAPYLMDEFDCFESFLIAAFHWDRTPEGHGYWHDMVNED